MNKIDENTDFVHYEFYIKVHKYEILINLIE